jgi:hypothetical protein
VRGQHSKHKSREVIEIEIESILKIPFDDDAGISLWMAMMTMTTTTMMMLTDSVFGGGHHS